MTPRKSTSASLNLALLPVQYKSSSQIYRQQLNHYADLLPVNVFCDQS